MKWPKMPAGYRGSLFVDSIAGGMNLAEATSRINDDQLSDCLNLYKRNGVLMTRPAFSGMVGGIVHSDDDGNTYELKKTEYTTEYEGIERTVFSLIIKSETKLSVYLVYVDSLGRLRNVIRNALFNKNTASLDFTGENVSLKGITVFRHEGEWYIMALTDSGEGGVYRYSVKTGYTQLTDEDFYIPLVLADATACDTYFSPCEGNIIENYNALTPYYRAVYSSYNLNNPYTLTDEAGNFYHTMIYALPAKAALGSTIRVKHTTKNGTVAEHSVVVGEGNYSDETKEAADGLIIRYMDGHICFYKGVSLKTVSSVEYLKDNIEIIATYDNSEEKKRILGCNISCRYGGSAAGIVSGTRLFLSGNTDCPGEIFYGGLSNPLYYSLSCCQTVGDSAEAVTTFGKQGNKLIIFKSNEVYSASYYQDTTITADDVISGRVQDLSAAMVYFPVMMVNSGIGCDCPKSVALCGNELVWANSNGKVYTLSGTDEYSTENVYELSRMIDQRLSLCDHSELKAAVAVAYDNMYILAVSNRMFVLNYGSTAFYNVSAYSDKEKAQRNLNWFYWEIPNTALAIAAENDRLLLAQLSKYGVYFTASSEVDEQDTNVTVGSVCVGVDIPFMFASKVFTAIGSYYLKRLEKLILTIGSNSQNSIEVSSFDEVGETVSTGTVTIEGNGVFQKKKTSLKGVHSVGFGIRAKGVGQVMFSGICAEYERIRSVR